MSLESSIRPVLLTLAALLAANAAVGQEAVPAAAAEAAVTVAPESFADLKYSNKWRIEVKEGANNDGTARFRVTPKGEAPIEVIVTIKEGRSENGVAADVKNALKAALDDKHFSVEGDDFEDVLVKSKKGPDFSLELVEETLKGTHFDVERE
jgi:hypothetical protein